MYLDYVHYTFCCLTKHEASLRLTHDQSDSKRFDSDSTRLQQSATRACWAAYCSFTVQGLDASLNHLIHEKSLMRHKGTFAVQKGLVGWVLSPNLNFKLKFETCVLY